MFLLKFNMHDNCQTGSCLLLNSSEYSYIGIYSTHPAEKQSKHYFFVHFDGSIFTWCNHHKNEFCIKQLKKDSNIILKNL